MTQALATVIVPFASERAGDVNTVLDDLGNLARAPLDQVLGDAGFVHFMSMVVVPAQDGRTTAHLVIEVCADGHPRAALKRLVEAESFSDALLRVLAETAIPLPAKKALGEFLEQRRWEFGTGLHRRAGLTFAGTPGVSVRRIREEFRLATEIRTLLDNDNTVDSAYTKLQRVRDGIFENVDLKWAFVSEPVPLLGEAKPVSLRALAKPAFRDFLWPTIALPALVLFCSWLIGGNLGKAVWHMVLSLVAALLGAGAIALIGYWMLRHQEDADVPVDAEPPQSHMREIQSRENDPASAQNHLGGVSTLKPGPMRYVTLRFGLWLIGELGTRRSKPGHIDRIGNIHFARWLQLPGTNQLVFLSNYDGSWQGYLEDFIARLRAGLTSVWSNTRDFPKTANLVLGGAGDAARFKRWARRQQQPTRFWYSAYPKLTTDRIRTNAAIRHGFASASNEREAANWLRLFGYAAPRTTEAREDCGPSVTRPASTQGRGGGADLVAAAEIPVLAFGGLGKLRFAHCLIVRFDETEAEPRWLAAIEPDITYGGELPERAALVAGFTSSGMGKLNRESLATFPTAFQDGMPIRARILGDDPSTWRWGRTDPEIDALLILYAADPGELREQIANRHRQLEACGGVLVAEIPLSELPKSDNAPREPFGFRDGISQPILRDRRDWPAAANAINTIRPGELVLGYRDNLGNIAPVPQCNGWEVGRNGTFLVVRQLEQDVSRFDKYLADTACALRGNPRVPNVATNDLAEWIAAKMMGRWRDGTSLVRNPERPGATAPDNEFQFGHEDPDGLRCPFGAHVRRANPRESLEPGSPVQRAISNRHRILRVGRKYEPKEGEDPGLLFMCVNVDIERQFEFLQQSWILGPHFHGLVDEIDPIVGYRSEAEDTMTVPTPHGPLRLQSLAKFVKVLGGGYFFMPGRSAVRSLLSPRDRSPHSVESYRRPWWAWGGHLQTIIPAALNELNWWPRIDWRRERWTTLDDDFIDIDWAGDAQATRLLVLFHGLEGNRKSRYSRMLARYAAATGWRFAFVNFRGCSGEPNRTARAYHAGDYEEIDWILRCFAREHSHVCAAGVSLGANALLRWLGEKGDEATTIVRSAAVVSAPLNLREFGRSLERGFGPVYGWFFLRTLRRKALGILQRFPGVLDERRLRAAWTLPQFDSAVTAPLHGFRDLDDYWNRASALPWLPRIRVPTLILNARNDPFLPNEVLEGVERSKGDLSTEVLLEFPPDGGHVGFPGRKRWMARRVVEFLSSP